MTAVFKENNADICISVALESGRQVWGTALEQPKVDGYFVFDDAAPLGDHYCQREALLGRYRALR